MEHNRSIAMLFTVLNLHNYYSLILKFCAILRCIGASYFVAISIPTTVQSIQEHAFATSALAGINVPTSVTSIGDVSVVFN